MDGGAPIEIEREIALVGRHAPADIVLDDSTVSKLHCVLAKTDGTVLLRDLMSTNGCRVNGTRVSHAALLPNDILTIGRNEYRLHLAPDDAPEARATRPIDLRTVSPEEREILEDSASVPKPRHLEPRKSGARSDPTADTTH